MEIEIIVGGKKMTVILVIGENGHWIVSVDGDLVAFRYTDYNAMILNYHRATFKALCRKIGITPKRFFTYDSLHTVYSLHEV